MIAVHDIAEICHEANRLYCKSQGDHSQVAWADAPDWQRDSAIKGVTAAVENGRLTPEDMHQSWCDHKIKEGWVFGPVKDPERKTHPCLRPYSDLPEEQRIKDYLFLNIVRSFDQAEVGIMDDDGED